MLLRELIQHLGNACNSIDYARIILRTAINSLPRSPFVIWLVDGQPCWMYIVCIYEYEDVVWGGGREIRGWEGDSRVCVYLLM